MQTRDQNVDMEQATQPKAAEVLPRSNREVLGLFEKIMTVQAGCINPESNKFVPIWPYCVKSLQMGNLIHDSNGRCDTV